MSTEAGSSSAHRDEHAEFRDTMATLRSGLEESEGPAVKEQKRKKSKRRNKHQATQQAKNKSESQEGLQDKASTAAQAMECDDSTGKEGSVQSGGEDMDKSVHSADSGTGSIDGSTHARSMRADPPDPWEQRLDPGTGRTYYFNARTGASAWDKPAQEWERRHDPTSRRVYYFSTRSGQSVWDKPPNFVEPGPVADHSEVDTEAGTGTLKAKEEESVKQLSSKTEPAEVVQAKVSIRAALEAGDHARVAVLAAELNLLVKKLAEERKEKESALKQKMLKALDTGDYAAVAALGEEFAAIDGET